VFGAISQLYYIIEDRSMRRDTSSVGRKERMEKMSEVSSQIPALNVRNLAFSYLPFPSHVPLFLSFNFSLFPLPFLPCPNVPPSRGTMLAA